MFDLILLTYLAYRNNVLAKQKEQNGLAWAFYTVVAYIVGLILGMFVVLVYFCKDVFNINQLSALDAKSRAVAIQQIQQYFYDHPLDIITYELFAVGGYLFVRYLLDRKPGKKEPEVHWMDKMGDQ